MNAKTKTEQMKKEMQSPEVKKSVGQNMMRLLTQKEAAGVSGAATAPTPTGRSRRVP